MRLEIRDLEDQTVYDIGPEGAVLGRERAKTDISLRDESISKRHARIFLDDGPVVPGGSETPSNGTYVDDQRISSPVMVTSGMALLVGPAALRGGVHGRRRRQRAVRRLPASGDALRRWPPRGDRRRHAAPSLEWSPRPT
jgi:pSer/pThr/pTyr-binding forkhead associated (FHA) protein